MILIYIFICLVLMIVFPALMYASYQSHKRLIEAERELNKAFMKLLSQPPVDERKENFPWMFDENGKMKGK